MSSGSRFGENNLSGQVVRAVRTLGEMFDDRGYANHGLRRVGDDDCISAVMSRETMQVEVSGDTLLVVYMAARHNGTNVRADLRKRLDPGVHRRVILVFREVPVNTEVIAGKVREEFGAPLVVETFSLAELQFNVTKHFLVPRHERVRDPVVVSAVLKTYNAKKAQLPVISRSDPVCRYLGAESGDVIRILRNSVTCGEHEVFRYCA
jgi:DNA-directed RNA polymerase subunit H (RpoH/RPB5)